MRVTLILSCGSLQRDWDPNGVLVETGSHDALAILLLFQFSNARVYLLCC